jgi:hypothetical protein
MSTNDPGDLKKQLDYASLVAFCVCFAAVGMFFFGGANWPVAVAVCSLSGMGLGIGYFILKKS